MPSLIGAPLPRKFVVNIYAYAIGGFTLFSTVTAWRGAHDWGAPLIALVVTLILLALPNVGPRDREYVQIDDTGVAVKTKEGIDHISWKELDRVRILTTSLGPWAEDIFFVLEIAKGKTCVIPHEAATRTQLLEELQLRLKGIRDDQVIAAMGCTSDNSFTIWEKESCSAV